MEREDNMQEQAGTIKRNIKSYERIIRQRSHNEIIFLKAIPEIKQ